MNIADVAYLPEQPAHDNEIEHLNAEAFGPGRFARAAYKIREGGPHERALSFVAMHEGVVIASVRMTRVAAGEGRALLLGPLAVRPDYKNLGIGRTLVRIAVEAAEKAGAAAVLLVGDEPLLRSTRLQEGPARAVVDAAAGRPQPHPCGRAEARSGGSAPGHGRS
jgi:predicted N-acetyltransferase YhbS